MKNNIILIDFKKNKNWTFDKELIKRSKENWVTKECKSNFKTNLLIKKLWQYFLFFLFPLVVFIKRKKYDKIIAWQQFYGINFALYCDLFKIKKTNQLYIMTFIYKKKKGFLGKLYFNYINKIIKSKYINRIICYSKEEIDYYKKIFPSAKEKFAYTTLGVGIPYKDVEVEKGDYFVSAGKSNRDYDFLINAFTIIKEKIKIISYTAPKTDLDNVEVLDNVFGKEYYNTIAKSFAVIISLDDENISSGQLVLIHAMQCGKPIICTKNNTIYEYVIDKKNGFIINKNIKELENKIKQLKDDDKYNKISMASSNLYKNCFSINHLAKCIYELIYI